MARNYPPFKMVGGKFYLNKWIISYFPAHEIYVEGCLGGGSVFWNKKSSQKEILIELNPKIYAIYFCIKNHPDLFVKKLKETPYAEESFLKAKDLKTNDIFEMGWAEYCKRRMSRGATGKNFAWSKRLRGGQPGDLNAWENAIDRIPFYSKRLDNVDIINDSIFNLIKNYNDKKCFIYLDPPYLQETRVSKKDFEEFEWTKEQHIEMANILNDNFKGQVMISGYNSDLYKEIYYNWKIETKEIVNHSSQQKKKPKKTEVIWMNYGKNFQI